jgi:hypothetical protein
MDGVMGDIIRNAQGLQGLAAMKMQIDENKAAQERQKIGMEALNKYRESAQLGHPDDNAFTTAVMNVPDAAKNVLASIGIKDNLQKKDAASFALKAANIVESPEQFIGAIDARIKYLQDAGRDPKDSIALREQYLAGDKEGVKRNLKGVAAALVGDGVIDHKMYESTFGEPEKMNEYQRQQIALQNRELDLQGRQINQNQAAIGMGTSNQKDWETYQRLLKTDPEQASAFGRAAGFLSKEGQQLSSFSEKQVSAASDEYNNANTAVTKYQNLADVIRSKKLGGGLGASWAEAIKEYTGDQNEITQLRKTVSEIVNSEAIKSLPPGPATDRDISLVREPFPTAKANGEYIANWLEAVSRLNQKRAEYAEHKAAFIAQNGGQRNKAGETVLSTWKAKQTEQAPAQPASSKYKIEVMQ